MGEKILVIAFDGLDKELIERFGLQNITQNEFGLIDNSTDMSKRITSELFASFISGKNYEEHGIEGLRKHDPKEKFLRDLIPRKWARNVTGVGTLEDIVKAIVKPDSPVKYDKEDLKAETLFEMVDNSRAMFVPSYNPSKFWWAGAEMKPLAKGASYEETAKYYDTREFSFRKNELFSELENEFTPTRDFLMCHFHRTDTYQHLFGDRDVGNFDQEKLRKLYHEMDEFAEEIIEKASNKGYNYIIFMSDHGLPEEDSHEHNKNAFYSCNRELFVDEKPKITEFFDRIVGLIGEQ